MYTKTKILISLAVVILVYLGYLILLPPTVPQGQKKKVDKLQTYLTSQPADKNTPLGFFAGTIDSINGNVLVITQTFSTVRSSVPSEYTQASETMSFKVVVKNTTEILHSEVSVPYLFKEQNTAKITYLKLKDLRPQQKVLVRTNTNLRTLKINEFEASSIEVDPITNSMVGRIISITGNKIVMKGTTPDIFNSTQSTSLTEKEYTATIDSETEISRFSPSTSTPEKLNLAFLKKNMTINVLTDKDTIKNQTIKALRIEPLDDPSLLPVPIASPSSGLTPRNSAVPLP